MATQQFESAKKLILHFTQKNCVSPESDIKGVMPVQHTLVLLTSCLNRKCALSPTYTAQGKIWLSGA
ncbi:hypothetical protein P7K49_007429 [Saguinus oedipus]|uniref:Uncharacterized protein n=1 Tax=Saguinus oedipus TaxID=9490 RepID=A0ABQ9VUV1_SAGOE|nr:hypothetical protein P7K49_007429 [Saguinus oedipus]